MGGKNGRGERRGERRGEGREMKGGRDWRDGKEEV